MSTVDGYKRALIDYIVATGEPMSAFGPSGRIAAEEFRAYLDICGGIDYARCELGDLGGESWTEDTYASSQSHPGLAATVVALGEPDGSGQRWFLDGSLRPLLLTEVIVGVIRAGEVGDRIWRADVTDDQRAEQRRRQAEYHAYLAETKRARPRRNRLP